MDAFSVTLACDCGRIADNNDKLPIWRQLGRKPKMYQTIQVSTCVSAQGELVERLPNGDAIVRDGGHMYRGRPIAPFAQPAAAQRGPRAEARRTEEA
jgi:hypothetical protein